MKNHGVFPWWAGYWLINPLRRYSIDPNQLLSDRVKPGLTILDAGCAMGFFSLPLAKMTGPRGRVVCVDPQKRMLAVLAKRAKRSGLSGIVEPRECTFSSLKVEDLAGTVDLALAFGVLHEVGDRRTFVREVAAALKPGALFIFAEPHVVKEREFAEELALIGEAGLAPVENQNPGKYRIVILKKKTDRVRPQTLDGGRGHSWAK